MSPPYVRRESGCGTCEASRWSRDLSPRGQGCSRCRQKAAGGGAGQRWPWACPWRSHPRSGQRGPPSRLCSASMGHSSPEPGGQWPRCASQQCPSWAPQRLLSGGWRVPPGLRRGRPDTAIRGQAHATLHTLFLPPGTYQNAMALACW